MVNPLDFIPALIDYGNVAYEYLRKLLTEDQISSYLDYFHAPTTTNGDAFRYITKELDLPETAYYALTSLARINALCNAAECPSEEPLNPESAFFGAFSALQAGMLIGAIVDDKGKEAILALAKHGKKFAENVGRQDDEFTRYLENLFHEFNKTNGRFPKNKEALRELLNRVGQGFIHTVDDEIEWGKTGKVKIESMGNRFTRVRENLCIKRKKSR